MSRLSTLLLRLRVRLDAHPKLTQRAILIAVLAAALLIALVPGAAFARGGGGGHAGGGGGGGGGGHSGGGGFGGGGFGGGGGTHGTGGTGGGGGYTGGGGFGGGFGGFGLWWLPFLFWGGGGLLTFVLFILLLTWLANSGRRSRPYQQTWEPEPTWAPSTARLDPEPGLASIAGADPAFDREHFLDRVRHAFFTLQQAWEARDLAPARSFMGRGLYLGWLTQVRQLVALHKVNRMEDVAITDLGFAAANHGSRYDHVTVRVDASAADYEVDERDGRVIFGDRVQRPFTEYWTFERTSGTSTPAKGLLDQTCPNCGAPAEINEVGECAYCRAAITSGRYDWVLARIDQADQWEAHAADAVYGAAAQTAVEPEARAGVAAIAERDPGFDTDAFLERFEMAYFLVQQALQDGDLEPVRPYLAGDLAGRWNREVAVLGEQRRHLLLENLNVQGVELEHAQVAAGSDIVVVQVVSVATRQVVGADGQRVAGDGVDQRLTEHWTLSRPTGTRTPEAGGVLAHRCPSCGEPLSVDELGHCKSCKAAINAGDLDWAIVAVDPESWWTRSELGLVRVL